MPSVFISPAGIAAGPSFGVGNVLKILNPIIVGNTPITQSSALLGIDLLPGGATFPSNGSVQGVSCRVASVFQFNTNTNIGTAQFFNFAATFQQDSGSARTLGPIYSLISTPTITANNGALTCADLGTVYPALSGVYFSPALNSIGGPTSTLATVACVAYGPLAIGSNWTVTNSIGLKFYDAAGAGTLTNQIAVDVQALAKATNNIGVRSNITIGANNYFLQGTGTAQCAFGGLFTTYNNIALVSNGVPSELATFDSAALTALIATTTIYTPIATGLFRISVHLQVTVVGTTSILGGTTGVVIAYTHGDSSIAQSINVPLFNQLSALLVTGTGNTTNTTATNSSGSVVIYALTGVAITYAIGYTSTGTAMNYRAHLKVEAL